MRESFEGVPDCDRQGAAFCIGVFLPAAVGVPMAIWGAVVHQAPGALEKPPRAAPATDALFQLEVGARIARLGASSTSAQHEPFSPMGTVPQPHTAPAVEAAARRPDAAD